MKECSEKIKKNLACDVRSCVRLWCVRLLEREILKNEETSSNTMWIYDGR